MKGMPIESGLLEQTNVPLAKWVEYPQCKILWKVFLGKVEAILAAKELPTPY